MEWFSKPWKPFLPVFPNLEKYYQPYTATILC